jgi:predicted nuclease of restriction endonuclease-like (RecB) superfamily
LSSEVASQDGLHVQGSNGGHRAPEEEIKDPFVLELFGLKDEFSEADGEAASPRRYQELGQLTAT